MIVKMAITKKPHRNEKFKLLLRDRYKNVQRAMADDLEISPSLVSRYCSGKGIGEDMRIHIETKLGLKDGWFDDALLDTGEKVYKTSDPQKQEMIEMILEISVLYLKPPSAAFLFFVARGDFNKIIYQLVLTY